MKAASGDNRGLSGEQTDLAGILLASLDQLAAAGQVDAACRLAGQACAALRLRDATAWGRFNALLHRLARRLDPAPRRRGG